MPFQAEKHIIEHHFFLLEIFSNFPSVRTGEKIPSEPEFDKAGNWRHFCSVSVVAEEGILVSRLPEVYSSEKNGAVFFPPFCGRDSP